MPKIVDHAAQRRRILNALWQVVAVDGAAAVSVRSGAAQAGMSKSSLAHYFPSQGALIAAAIEQAMDGTQKQVDRLDLDSPALETMVKACSLAVPDTPARRRQAEVWLFLAGQVGDRDLRRTLRHLNARVNANLRFGLEAMSRNGLLGEGRDVEVEARRLHALIDGLSLQVVTDPRRTTNAFVHGAIAQHLGDLASPARPL